MEDVWSVSDTLEILREMKSQGVPFNKDTYMLAFATCYKLVGIQWIHLEIARSTSAH